MSLFTLGFPQLENLLKERKSRFTKSRFAQKCTQHERFSDLFPKTENKLNLRKKKLCDLAKKLTLNWKCLGSNWRLAFAKTCEREQVQPS